MDIDDEEPPLLVEAPFAKDSSAGLSRSDVDDVGLAKVPITLITG